MTGRRSVRPFVWLLHVALPVAGLYLLVTKPTVDAALVWHHPPSHFWLVLGAAFVSSALAYKAGAEARAAGDPRLLLASASFLVAAGFLGLHALGTPGVLVDVSNTGFVLGTPVGLALASIPALASAFVTARNDAVVRAGHVLFGAIVAVFVLWAVWSLARLFPLDGQPVIEQHRGLFAVVAVPAAALYCVAAARYYLLYRRRPSVVLLSVLTAFVLLAEATIATMVGRNWEASWWSWHVLMTGAFALVAYAALVEFSREGSQRTLFRGVALDETLAAVRRDYATALDEVVGTIGSGEHDSVVGLAAGLAERFDLSDAQVQLLAQAADALGNERDRARRLAALVAIGHDASVFRDEHELVTRATEHLRTGFAPDDVTVELGTATTDVDALTAPLVVKGHTAGQVAVTPRGARAGRAGLQEQQLLEALASQLSIALENVRLYHDLDRLFRQYLSPDVAAALLADPAQAALGGEHREVTVLFADLQGFTSFSERRDPADVVSMLNDYFGVAVPLVLREGGTVAHFIGDALMVLFNAPVRQADHALRAVRAALAVCAAIDDVAQRHDGWPRIRVGINTGTALIGNIGGEEVRCYTAIGDAVNLASRLEPLAPAGAVIVGERTRDLLGGAVSVRALAPIQVKGKGELVQPYLVLGAAAAGATGAAGAAGAGSFRGAGGYGVPT